MITVEDLFKKVCYMPVCWKPTEDILRENPSFTDDAQSGYVAGYSDAKHDIIKMMREETGITTEY